MGLLACFLPAHTKKGGRIALFSKSVLRHPLYYLRPYNCLFLLIALILYLITSPFSILAEWLVGDELAVVEEFQKEYGYNQNIKIFLKRMSSLIFNSVLRMCYGHDNSFLPNPLVDLKSE